MSIENIEAIKKAITIIKEDQENVNYWLYTWCFLNTMLIVLLFIQSFLK